jgi:KRAB domain-containing zinc finger protein
MENSQSSCFSSKNIDNIKQEPSVEFLLILPQPPFELPLIKVEHENHKAVELKYKPKKCFQCGKCDRKLTSKISLENHSKICGKEKLKVNEHLKFQCDLCPHFCSLKGRLRNHMVVHQELRPHVCLECGEGFKEASGLKRHISRMREYSCVTCNFECNCQFTLLNHYKTHQKFKCDQCSYVTSKKSYLKIHQTTHTKTFSCETCDKNVTSKFQLESHQKFHRHGPFKEIPDDRFDCEKCDKSFKLLSGLKNHTKHVHDVAEIKCNICSKVFKNKHYLLTHVSIHNKLPCKVCNGLFSKHIMSVHLREHSESQEYHCDLCGGQYKRRNSIKTHMVDIHKNGEYVCILCRERFNSVHKLFDHKKFHIGRKQYKCLKCSAILQSNFCLKRHNKKKH